ncbi:MAG TPA: ABC transporter ATP-binding protein [Candidatus Bathyarchaeia archaeon]|nr:ABC transporter ATP-binding protein [Candidatus Bathyarchaeia archaeon]
MSSQEIRQIQQDKKLVEIQNLKVYFHQRSTMLGKKVTLHAVDDVTLTLKEGEVLGLVGESGSGKSTLARTIVKLHRPTSGQVAYRGEDISRQDRKSSKEFRRHVQMIFQDPYESLNPQANVFNAVLEPLIIHGLARDKTEREAKVIELLRMVGLDPASKMDRFPHELSGGERQRVAIARALSLNPELLIADEPVSMLDVSIRLGILNLMLELKERLKLTYLFITHDLGVARYIATTVAVMYHGKIVEIANPDELIAHPLHHYTNLLLASIPGSELSEPSRQSTEYTFNPAEPPQGCRFHPRCAAAKEKCSTEEPTLTEIRKDHFVSCHYPLAA